MLVAILLVGTALIAWRVREGSESHNDNRPDTDASPVILSANPAMLKLATSSTNQIEADDSGYQHSTNLAALPLKKRLFVTNNFVPLLNQFLRQFPTQHHPIEAKDIAAVTVNYGVNSNVWAVANVESGDGKFQFSALTVDGTNHIQSYRDLTDFDISQPGTVNELKNSVVGTSPSVITTAAQAKAFAHDLLAKYNFDFQNYLNPPVAVPYTALQNYGLWQVHYISKRSDSGQAYVDFVIDGTGKSGSFLRWAYQTPQIWSLPGLPQQ